MDSAASEQNSEQFCNSFGSCMINFRSWWLPSARFCLEPCDDLFTKPQRNSNISFTFPNMNMKVPL